MKCLASGGFLAQKGGVRLFPEARPEPWAGMRAGMWLAGAGAMPHPFCSKGTPSQESGLEGFETQK